ncbi:MAG: polysaccharide biosynthesis protein [Alphaproteobacteria bacterium CG_4_10_14_0_2_um_filter_63_37]|nr:MAG: polysaccharide biosynthesis protein [Proteobacteria bacterium CG1_02_64_396]PJA24536.1 MAG: polysaccharide biosynthesis protein [Alphaproteobacteria bacterium CG_4_10_14_0_2_um_filter_63_37]
MKVLKSRWLVILHDLFWVPAALIGAYWLRFNLGSIPDLFFDRMWALVGLAVPIQLATFWWFGLYRGIWRFASMPDLMRIVQAVGVGSLVLGLAAVQIYRMVDIPRSALLLYPMLLVLGLAGPRSLYRWLQDRRSHHRRRGELRALVVGSGREAEALIRGLSHQGGYLLVGLIDGHPKKQGRELLGVRVLGVPEQVLDLIRAYHIDVVLFAADDVEKVVLEQVVEACGQAHIPARILPSMRDMADGKFEVSKLRPLTVEDILGRQPILLDMQAIGSYLKGKRVLITGGGGSIGSELCRQIAARAPEKLIILEHGEFNLYQIEREIRALHPGLNLVPVLGDVRDPHRAQMAFEQHRPEVVFHAAAYKHVPMVEANPEEGVFNNVMGTKVIADLADRYGAERFVLVSTDKAVNPTNVMGTTKRVAEIYCQNLALRSTTRFITTRFGNVLGSAGSVVPLFQEQIANGGPVTVTHPEITRYFMTIPEAVGLILQAGSMGSRGEIFVLDMGEPVRIQDLAEQMIRLSGKEPGRDIEIVHTGLRPGEKLFEELFHETEALQGTNHPKLLLAAARRVDWNWLLAELATLEEVGRSQNEAMLREHLQKLVPESRLLTSPQTVA